MIAEETPTYCDPPNGKAISSKSEIIRRIARLVRLEGLDYAGWRYVAKKVRQLCKLRPERQGRRRLPNVLTADEFRRFYATVDQAGNVLHALMLRLLFYTAVRVSELCSIEVRDIDFESCKVRINHGKGDKDRVVLFGASFATALRAFLDGHPKNRYLFQTRLGTPFGARRIQQIVKVYAAAAGVRATPHTFRHQAITWLTHAGIADVGLQLLTGHAKRETLAIYQHVSLGDGQLEERYQKAMREVQI